MPNRMLRDWTDSEKINNLSVYSERFFIRLIMKADDFGCFSADTRLLKANLFPLLLDTIREADLIRWMTECQKAGLIVLYESSNKKLLQIVEFKQRLDRAKSKYALPKAIINNPQVITRNAQEVVNDYPAEQNRSRTEIEVEVEGKITRPNLENSNLFRQPKIPEFLEVQRIFQQQGGTTEMAQKFFDSNEGTGWFHKGSPITSFSNFVPGFITSWNKYGNKNQIQDNPNLTPYQIKLNKAL